MVDGRNRALIPFIRPQCFSTKLTSTTQRQILGHWYVMSHIIIMCVIQQVHDDGTAPHLAGHSACMLSDSNRMAVFGGSFGNGSSNHVWLFDMRKRIWQLVNN